MEKVQKAINSFIGASSTKDLLTLYVDVDVGMIRITYMTTKVIAGQLRLVKQSQLKLV